MKTNTTPAKFVFCGALMMVSFMLATGNPVNAQTFMWAKQIGGAVKQETSSSIAKDASGNTYVAGLFYNTSINIGGITLTKSDASYPDIFVAKYNASGVAQWAKRAGGSSTESSPLVTVDASGNVFLSGFTSSTSMTVDATALAASYGGGDIFLAKLNTSGVVQWVKRAGGNGGDMAASIKTDTNGNIYAFGTYRGTNIAFGTTVLTNGHNGQDELFLVKYNTSGIAVWAVSGAGTNVSTPIASSTGLEVARCLDIDASNNIYIGGHFGVAKLAFQSAVANNSGLEGTYDIFMAKFNDAGSLQWLKKEGSNGSEYLSGLATDNLGRIDINASYCNIYSAYTFTIGSTTLSSSMGISNTFLAQYTSAGAINWLIPGRTQSESFLRTDSIGNIYITGRYGNPCNDVVTASTEMAIFRYTSSGAASWIKKCSGSSAGNNIKDLIVTRQGNLVMTGDLLSNTMTFGSSTITKSDAVGSNIDFYIASMHGLNLPVITASSSVNIFTGQTATLNATSATSYTWSNGATSASISAGAGTYTVITNDGTSNSASSCPVTVTSSAIPTITASGPTSFCAGGSVILTVNSTGTSYLWSNGATSQTITASASGNYSVTITYANGSSVTTAATTVTSNPYPVLPSITGNTNVCNGSTTQLSNATTGGVWASFNTSVATISASGLVTGVAEGLAQIQYIVTSSAGCASTVAKTITTMSTYNASTNSSFTYSGGSTGYDGVCLGPNATRALLFKVALNNPVAGYYPKLSSVSVRRNSVAGSQDYNNHDSICIYYSSDPNATDLSVINNTANMLGNAFADLTLIGSNFSITMNNGGLCVSPGNHYIYIVAYEAANSSGQGFDAWSGNTLAGSPAPSTNSTIEYKLQTFNYGCASGGGTQYSFGGFGAAQTCNRRISSTCASTSRLAGNLNNDGTQLDGTAYTPQLELSCYPNPFNDKTTFRFSTEESGATRLLITDMTGRLVKEVYSGYLSAGLEQELEFDGSLLPAGMYFYSLSCGAKTRTGKMINTK